MKRVAFGALVSMFLPLAVSTQQTAAPATNPVSDAVRRLVATECKTSSRAPKQCRPTNTIFARRLSRIRLLTGLFTGSARTISCARPQAIRPCPKQTSRTIAIQKAL